mgnify:CR=1 FL=1
MRVGIWPGVSRRASLPRRTPSAGDGHSTGRPRSGRPIRMAALLRGPPTRMAGANWVEEARVPGEGSCARASLGPDGRARERGRARAPSGATKSESLLRRRPESTSPSAHLHAHWQQGERAARRPQRGTQRRAAHRLRPGAEPTNPGRRTARRTSVLPLTPSRRPATPAPRRTAVPGGGSRRERARHVEPQLHAWRAGCAGERRRGNRRPHRSAARKAAEQHRRAIPPARRIAGRKRDSEARARGREQQCAAQAASPPRARRRVARGCHAERQWRQARRLPCRLTSAPDAALVVATGSRAWPPSPAERHRAGAVDRSAANAPAAPLRERRDPRPGARQPRRPPRVAGSLRQRAPRWRAPWNRRRPARSGTARPRAARARRAAWQPALRLQPAVRSERQRAQRAGRAFRVPRALPEAGAARERVRPGPTTSAKRGDQHLRSGARLSVCGGSRAGSRASSAMGSPARRARLARAA